MGQGSSTKKTEAELPHKESLVQLFKELCSYGLLDKDEFTNYFGGESAISTNLFNRFFIDLLNESPKTSQLFVERANLILETVYKSPSERLVFYFDLITEEKDALSKTDVRQLFLESCTYALKNDEYSPPGAFLESLVLSCIGENASITREEVLLFLQESFINIFGGLEAWIFYKLTKTQLKSNFQMLTLPRECQEHKLMLSSALFWYLCSTLATCFIRMENKYKHEDEEEVDESEDFTWNLLYDSNQHGLSLNRFKNKMMNYKSATLSIFQMASGVTLVLALDQHWRDSPEKFGGAYCQLIEVSPSIRVLEANSSMVYLKENGRAIATGLQFGSDTRAKVVIDKDLSHATLNYRNLHDETLDRVEVWGCGGVKAIRKQEDLKKWERNEIEKRKKVKLPGQWDTDKTILEMGGVTVNHAQR